MPCQSVSPQGASRVTLPKRLSKAKGSALSMLRSCNVVAIALGSDCMTITLLLMVLSVTDGALVSKGVCASPIARW